MPSILDNLSLMLPSSLPDVSVVSPLFEHNFRWVWGQQTSPYSPVQGSFLSGNMNPIPFSFAAHELVKYT